MPLQLSSNEQTAQTLVVGLRRMYDGVVDSVLFQNDQFLGLPGVAREPSQGGDSYNWAIHRGGNTSVATFAEGDAAPASGNQTYSYARMPYSNGYFRGVVGISGHMRDAATSEAAVFNLLDEEFERVKINILDLFTTTVLGAGAMGIQLAVDSAGTYAGIDRAVVAAWGSEENATSGVLIDDLDLAQREMKDAELGVLPSFHLVSPAQAENYSQLSNTAGGVNVTINSEQGAPVKLDQRPIASQHLHGAPIIEMPDLTNTIWLMLNSQADRWKAVEHRPFSIDPLGPTSDTPEFQVSLALVVVCRNPQKQLKITGLAV